MKILCADQFWDKVFDYVERKAYDEMNSYEYTHLVREAIKEAGGCVVIGV